MALMTAEEALRRANEIAELYPQDTGKFSAIIMGEYGTGKTLFICSGVYPILIDSFDPNGTLVIKRTYPELIKERKIVIRTFWDENSKDPQMFDKWEEQFEQDIESGFLNYFGTYGIDSMTTWVDTIAHRVGKEFKREWNKLAIQDYPVIYDYVKDTIKKASSQDVNFILTAHVVLEKDDLTGAIEGELKAYKSLKVDIPLLFSEKYVMQKSPAPPPQKVKYEVLTKSAGRFNASSQLIDAASIDITGRNDGLRKIIEMAGFEVKDKVL